MMLLFLPTKKNRLFLKLIKAFPKEYETYDFLNACDVLVTDYSSVFFDYANLKKKMKSFIAKPAEVERKWYVVDAEGKTLGRMASEIASVLRGKNKPIYTPHVDCGDYVIVINAEKVEVTGKKRKEKIYKRHTGYPGGLREMTFEQMLEKHPTEVVRHAVKGMMPNGKLGRQMYKKLKVYAGPEHDHAAQKPEVLDI